MSNSDYIKQLENQNDELKEMLAKFQSYQTLSIPTMTEEWWDKDEVMFHAVFTLLERFVEDEWKGVLYQTDMRENMSDEEIELYRAQDKDRVELFNLYKWWKNEYPKLAKKASWHIDGYDIETKYAMRVLELRRYLWT